MGSGTPKLKNRVKKPSCGLWRHKTELSHFVTSKLMFCKLETLQWINENKKAELSNSKILLDKKCSSYLTRVFDFLFFILRFLSYVTRNFYFH